MCWVAFSELAKSKEEGGLDLRDLRLSMQRYQQMKARGSPPIWTVYWLEFFWENIARTDRSFKWKLHHQFLMAEGAYSVVGISHWRRHVQLSATRSTHYFGMIPDYHQKRLFAQWRLPFSRQKIGRPQSLLSQIQGIGTQN